MKRILLLAAVCLMTLALTGCDKIGEIDGTYKVESVIHNGKSESLFPIMMIHLWLLSQKAAGILFNSTTLLSVILNLYSR